MSRDFDKFKLWLVELFLWLVMGLLGLIVPATAWHGIVTTYGLSFDGKVSLLAAFVPYYFLAFHFYVWLGKSIVTSDTVMGWRAL